MSNKEIANKYPSIEIEELLKLQETDLVSAERGLPDYAHEFNSIYWWCGASHYVQSFTIRKNSTKAEYKIL
jgi:hypothetical protein